MTNTGYYSLIQFCPDWLRREVANVGVVLFCQEISYLDVKIEHDKSRVQHFFGKTLKNIDYIQTFKKDIEYSFHRDSKNIKDINQLKDYYRKWVNHFVYTEPRAITITGDPHACLEQLYDDVFEASKPKTKKKRIKELFINDIRTKMGDAFDKRIKVGFTIKIPHLTDEVKCDLGFQNGTFNNVRIETLSKPKATQLVCAEAFIGKAIYNAGGNQKLILLCNKSESDPVEEGSVNAYREMLKENKVDFYYDNNGRKLLLSEIAKAKVLPKNIAASK